jgi:hypothetical protein
VGSGGVCDAGGEACDGGVSREQMANDRLDGGRLGQSPGMGFAVFMHLMQYAKTAAS